jgi:hypothetical protein
VQGLADSRAIVVSGHVVENREAAALIEASGLKPSLRHAELRGIADEMVVYDIP